MAVVRAGRGGLRMNNLSFDSEGAQRSGTPTQIVFAFSENTYLQFDGQFSYDQVGRPSGTINAITNVDNGRVRFSVTEATADAQAFFGSADEQAAAALLLAGDDRILGGNKGDTLYGYNGDDRIFAKAGVDTLWGGLGADVLEGGADADEYQYRSIDESTVAGTGRDTINGFNQAEGDRINLSKIDAIDGTQRNNDFTVVTEFTNTAGELVITGGDGRYTVRGDTDGDGKANFSIVVNADVPLTADGIIL